MYIKSFPHAPITQCATSGLERRILWTLHRAEKPIRHCAVREVGGQSRELDWPEWVSANFVEISDYALQQSERARLGASTGMLLLWTLKPLKLYRFRAGDHYAKRKAIRNDH